MTLKNLVVGVAMVFVAACGGTDTDTDTDTKTDPPATQTNKLDVEQTVAVSSAAKKLILNNDFGAIKVVGEAGRNEVNMKPTLRSSDPGAGTIEVVQDGDSLIVQVSNTSSETIAVDVVVYTPMALDFTVNTSGGALDLSGMVGGGVANTGAGNCTIDMELGASSDLTVNTSNGNIALTLPNVTAATLTASAGGGTLTIASSLDFDGYSAMGNATGNLNGGGSSSINLVATGGNIAVNGK
ncbi:MAG: hypothetical protein A2V77_20870 [Anaeromyxobacter sp. RBG_16_69_14]|nr:MAG: hypothetical protein A2V77_20870 [Anaeromyxobacter sp. RBG_16_69_14]